MTFAKRLDEILTRKFGSASSQKHRAEACGFQYEYFLMIVNGTKAPPRDEKIVSIAQNLNLSDAETADLLTLAAIDRAKDPETKSVISRVLLEGMLSIDPPTTFNAKPIDLPQTNYYTVPVWASVQAGTGQLSEQNTEVVDEVLIAEEEYKAKCFAVQISGNSMEPEIKDGDIGIFEPPNGLQPAENDIVIVELEGYGQWMVKRLKIYAPGKVDLVSSNKDHSPIRVNLDSEHLEIKGILLRTVRKFKKRLFLK